ncbi:MAG: DUF4160 domain-containing protein [Clostridia bacterium]|nr:DUF4160 domain-containing protein [Clostridia bacterium]
MPTLSEFRGIKIAMYWSDHMPPHFHAYYGGDKILVSIKDIDVLEGEFPHKQLKMVLGWAAIRQNELMDNWELAVRKQELFTIEPLR